MCGTRRKRPAGSHNPGDTKGAIIVGKEQATNLYDLTGQESGIVIYENKAVIVCNWANICPSHGLPIAGPIGGLLICWPDEVKYINHYAVDDVRDALPGSIIEVGEEDGQKLIETEGMDIVSDYNGDICALWGYDLGLDSDINRDEAGNLQPTPGTVYELEGDVIVIAPDGWC